MGMYGEEGGGCKEVKERDVRRGLYGEEGG